MAERELTRNNQADSLFKRSTGVPKYYCYSESSKIIIPTSLQEKILQFDETKLNIKSSYKRNQFAIQSLLAIGGGAHRILDTCLQSMRVGCSTNDKLSYLSGYQDNATITKTDLTVNLDMIAGEIFGEENLGKHDVLIGPMLDDKMVVKFDTYSGAIFKSLGYNKKEDVMAYVYDDIKMLHFDWITREKSTFFPTEIIETAARPKLSTKQKVEEKAEAGKPQGRVISMPSIYEQFIGYPIYKVASDCAAARVCKAKTFISIGIKRNSEDWVNLGKMISSYSHTYEGDWSMYDQTIPRFLIEVGLDILSKVFNMGKSYNSNYFSNFRRWFMENMVDKTYLVDNNLVINIDNGIPSGSMFTSLLNSVINYVVLSDLFNLQGIKDRQIIVYGDDHLVNFNKEGDVEGELLKESLSEIAKQRYGMILKTDDLKVLSGDTRFVTYERPIYKPGSYLVRGTRMLKPIFMEHSKTPFTSFDHMKGSTHRFQYRFKDTVSFLKYHFLYGTYLPIRPLQETLTRLVNPEKRPSNLIMHKQALFAALADNRHNAHVYNYIFQMYYDTFDLAKLLVKGGEGFDSKFSLWDRSSDYYKWYTTGKVKIGDRMWFRRMSMDIPFEEHPSMRGFKKNFEWEFSKLCKVRDSQNVEFYEVDKLHKSFAEMGIFVKSYRDMIEARRAGKEPEGLGKRQVFDTYDFNVEQLKGYLQLLTGSKSYSYGMRVPKLSIAMICKELRTSKGFNSYKGWISLRQIGQADRVTYRKRRAREHYEEQVKKYRYV